MNEIICHKEEYRIGKRKVLGSDQTRGGRSLATHIFAKPKIKPKL
jgi:hypothetical protein